MVRFTTSLPSPSELTIDSTEPDQFDASVTDTANNKNGYRMFRGVDGSLHSQADGGVYNDEFDTDGLPATATFSITFTMETIPDDTGILMARAANFQGAGIKVQPDGQVRMHYVDRDPGYAVSTDHYITTVEAGEECTVTASGTYTDNNERHIRLWANGEKQSDFTTGSSSFGGGKDMALEIGRSVGGHDRWPANTDVDVTLHRAAYNETFFDDAQATAFDEGEMVDDGCIVYHIFNDGWGDTVDDYSGNDHYARLITGTYEWVDGAGGSLSFDGSQQNQYVSIPDRIGEYLDGREEASISLRVSCSSNNPDNSDITGGLLAFDGSGTGNNHYPYTDENIYFSVFRNNRVDGITDGGFDKTVPHVLTITTEPGSSGYNVYQDTTNIHTTSGESTVSLGKRPIALGWNASTNSTNYFNGDIYGVWLYDRALSQSEVEANAKNNIVRDGLVSEWRFDDKAGPLVFDYTQRRNHGKRVSTPTWNGGSGIKRVTGEIPEDVGRFNRMNGWTLYTAEQRSDRTYNGSHSLLTYADGNGGSQASYTVAPGGARIEKLTYHWQEQSSPNYGGGVRLVNSNEEYEGGIATDNPQWDVDFANTSGQVADKSGYNRWVRGEWEFDWDSGTVDITFSDLYNGNSYSGTFTLKQGVDVRRLELWNYNSGDWGNSGNHKMWWDGFSVDHHEPRYSIEGYHYVGDYDALDFSSDFSFGFWMRDYPDSANNEVLVHKGQARSIRGYICNLNDGNVYFTIGDSDYNTDGVGASIVEEEPHFVVCVYDSTNTEIRIYVDGEHRGTTQTSKTPASFGEALVFGRRADWGTWYYRGLLSDIRLITRAVTDSEVTDWYNGSPPTTDILAHWPTNDGHGSDTVTDVTGNGYDAGADPRKSWGPEIKPIEHQTPPVLKQGEQYILRSSVLTEHTESFDT